MNPIEQKIRNAIVKAQEKGYTLVCEDWGDNAHKCGCALGCVLVAEDKLTGKSHDNFTAIASILGQSHEWIDSFIAAFDKGYITYGDIPVEEAYQMGKRLREELNPKEYDKFLREFLDGQN